jgi:hypothetical protein
MLLPVRADHGAARAAAFFLFFCSKRSWLLLTKEMGDDVLARGGRHLATQVSVVSRASSYPSRIFLFKTRFQNI